VCGTKAPPNALIVKIISFIFIDIWNMGYRATVSQVIADPEGPTFISSSYDATLKVWDLNSHSCIKTLQGHSSAVNDFVWKRSLVVSIGRDGLMIAWVLLNLNICMILYVIKDVNTGKRVETVKHSSHVSAVCLLEEAGMVVTGTQVYSYIFRFQFICV
jgi:WD40 repeat protein